MGSIRDAQHDDDIFTVDTRPLGPEVQNRPGAAVRGQPGQIDPRVREAFAATEHWLIRQDAAPRPVSSEPVAMPVLQSAGGRDLAVQLLTVFGYAMVGAVLFHLGWWMLAA